MQQDKKVGLALALLVLGFVGAFCLRQDHTSTTVDIPELNDPNYLDEQIADKGRTPYFSSQGKEKSEIELRNEQVLTGLSDESLLNSNAERSTPANSRTTPVSPIGTKTSKADRWGPIPDFLKDVEVPGDDVPGGEVPGKEFSDSELSDPVFEPNPKQPTGPPAFERSISDSIPSGSNHVKPGHNNAWEVNPSQQKQDPVRSERRHSPQLRIHTVRSGETLSEISIRYLGSSRRYREIFNLNRDQLRSPNDIREGMKLKVPVHPSSQTKPQSANSQTFSGASANAGKRTIGKMVSQPTLKSSPSTVQFEGLIESLTDLKDQKTIQDLKQNRSFGQLEETNSSRNIPNRKQENASMPQSYRKFIPIPRSPLTPKAVAQPVTKQKTSLSQVQPENMNQIVEGVFSEFPSNTNQSGKTAKTKTYTIKQGDTLESIAVRLYGKRSAAFQIYQKNSQQLKNANYIRPGMVLQLP